MQTALQLFDLSAQVPSIKGQKAVAVNPKQAGDVKSAPMDAFAEIMNALLKLPKEQLKNSLPDIDAANLDTANLDALMAGGDDENATPLAKTDGTDGKNVALAELLQLILNMKGAIPPQFQSMEAKDKPQLLLDMVKAYLQDPQAFAGRFAKANGDVAKLQRVGQDDPTIMAAPLQAQNAISDEAQLALERTEQSPFTPGMDPKTDKRKNPLKGAVELAGPKKASDDISLALKAAVPEKFVSKTSKHPNPGKGFLFKTSDPPTDGGAKQAVASIKHPLAAGSSKPLPVENLQDNKSQSSDKEHPSLSVAGVQKATVDAATDVDGKILEDHLLQKLVSPSGERQGILVRMAGRQDSSGLPISGDKAVLQQDKTAQTDVIRQIVQRMSLHTQGGQSKMVIHLKPEFLGNVHMHVMTENQQVTVRMMADSTMVKDIIQQNIQHLQAQLMHHGLEIQKFDVFVANDGQGWRGGQEQAGFGNGTNQKQSRSGGGRSKPQRGKVTLDVGNRQQESQKDPSEIDYFA
jgi:Flagellar hook-length control protein FliK